MYRKIYGTKTKDVQESQDHTQQPQPSQQIELKSVIFGDTCVICWEKRSDVLLSCGHYKHCSKCFENLKTTYEKQNQQFQNNKIPKMPEFKCPLCNICITGHLRVDRIFS